ncbi:MAG: 4Fe-4S dicluster domain-containing protein [Candidatus Omnitrophota bacterium]
MLNKYKRFRGGYLFKKPIGTFAEGIENAPVPAKVVIPLKLRFGSTVTLLVKKGDRVKAGQVIARDDESVSAPAIASVNGVIEDILQIDYFYGKVEAVVIRSNGEKGCIEIEGATRDHKDLSFEKISELLYISGAASLGKSGIPTIFKSSPARPRSIDNLIITTFGTGPFSLDDKILFQARGEDFYNGLSILKRALPEIKATIMMDKKDTGFIKEMIDVIRRGSPVTKTPDWIFIQPLEKRYPQESEDMLVRTILKKKIPLGGLGTDIGTLILDIHDVLRVFEAVALGKPFIERTVAISGSACKVNKYVNLRIGSLLNEVLEGNIKENVKPRVIFGNAMTGLVAKDLSMPVGRSIGHVTVLEENAERQFLTFLRPGFRQDSYSKTCVSSYVPSAKIKYDTNIHGEPRTCIQCGFCEELCPVGIIPHILSKQVGKNMCEGMEKLGIFECIDCGLCSYVCPSKIALTYDIAKGRRILIEDGCPVPRVKVKESEEAVKSYRGRMPL